MGRRPAGAVGGGTQNTAPKKSGTNPDSNSKLTADNRITMNTPGNANKAKASRAEGADEHGDIMKGGGSVKPAEKDRGNREKAGRSVSPALVSKESGGGSRDTTTATATQSSTSAKSGISARNENGNELESKGSVGNDEAGAHTDSNEAAEQGHDLALREEQHKEAIERHTKLVELRENHLNAAENRPNASAISKLDSSLKKNTAFVRKLKLITEESRAALIKEFDGLNLSKYVSECVSSICEGKLKNNDMAAVVELCGLFHRRYADFSDLMGEKLCKALGDPAGALAGAESVTAVAVRYRSMLRLFGELIINGVLNNTGDFLNCFKDIVVADKEKHQLLTVIVSFIRHAGEEMVGIVTRKQAEYRAANNYEAIPRLNILAADEEKKMTYFCEGYYSTLSRRLVRDHGEINQWENTNERIVLDKGELSATRQTSYDEKLKAYEKLAAGTATLADLLDQDYPDLPKREALDRTLNVGISVGGRGYMEGEVGEGQLWEDDDTRAFYEDLVQLRDVVPAVLLGEIDGGGEGTAEVPVDAEQESLEGLAAQEELDIPMEDEDTPTYSTTDEALGDSKDDAFAAGEEQDDNDEKETDTFVAEASDEEVEEDANTPLAMKLKLEALFEQLPNAMNREAVDKMAVELCYVNNKATRKRLGRTLAGSDVNRFDLLPYYSRLIATLSPVMPDLIGYVTEPLEREFRWQQAKSKKQVNLDFRTRVIRYFAELTKFGVYKKQNALNVLQRLVADFVGFNIDLACVFLEHCGVFLYRSGESHARTAKYLEIMMRKRAAQRMDAQHVSAIENAFYICNPPPSTRKVRKDRPSVQLYIRHLLYTKLNKSTCIYVTKQIRKLPWGNPEVRNYAIKCLSKPWKCKHGSVRQLAAVVDGLDVYQEGVAMRVVDATVEHIRLGLEVNRLDWNRMRLSTIHYFGELYVYQMVSTSLLQDTLYTCLLFGHDLYSNPNAPSQSPLDPPGNYFRVRLVCALLDVVGLYLTGSNTKKKLEFFLMFFQRYSLGKQLPLPVEVDFLIQDIFDTLAPKAKLYSTWVEANEAILTLQNQLVGDALQKQREDFEKKNPTTQTHTKDSGESTNATTAATQSPAADTQVSDAHTPSVVVQKAPQDAETASISGSQLSQSTSLRSLGGSEAESDLSDNDNDNEAASELDENGEAYDDNDTYGGSEAETRGDRNGNPESDAESESELDEKKQQPSDKDECDSDSDNDSDRTTAHDSDDGGFNSVRLRKAPQPHEPDEFDLMFIDEFSKFASDQNVARRNEAKTSVLDIPIPISVKKVTLAKADQMGTLSASAADAQRNSGTNSEMTDEWPTLGGGDEDINRTQTPQQAQSQVHHEDTAIARALAPTSTVAVKAHYGAEGMVRKPSPGGSGIKFALMTKKGNKPQLKDIDVPMDSTFALNIKKKQEEELAEQRELKRFVLDYEERAEEMEAQEALQEQRAATWKAAQQAKKPPTMENRQSEREDITSKFTSIAMGPRRHPPADNSKRNR